MSEKISEIVEKIKGLSLVEASELKKALETEFGVSASAPVMMGAAAPVAAAAVEEKTEFDVILLTTGDKKINVIKVVRAHTGLGLKEAVSKDEAEKLKKEFEDAGATVELK